ncbi:hypothetical protein Q8A67_021251 [Cirrhinus molitorella]|uniref:Uncharacterized protein n=1 Tax=Cirrhinus molitorella TaxID=172907 RepID=A0AA88P5G1_9TELE|nr:hypothetical protein Q8A67_021251 [Cirrhinus molitorella]
MNKTQSALSAFRLQVSIYHPPVVRQRTHPEERQTAPLRQRSELTVAAECAVIRVMYRAVKERKTVIEKRDTNLDRTGQKSTPGRKGDERVEVKDKQAI